MGLLQFVQVRSDPKLLAVSDLSKSYRDLDKLGARDPGSHGFRVLASVSKSPFVGFAPWIIFSVVATDVGWEIAATAGLLSSAILSYPSFERGTLKILDYAGFIFFAALVVLGLFLARSELDWLEEYSTVISMGTIAVVVFGSLRFVPFTEQYARETVPKEVQQTASFKHTNRHLTTVWGFVFLVVAVDSLIQQLTDSSSALLDWVIPVAAIVGGFKYTAYYVAKVRAGRRGPRSPPRDTLLQGRRVPVRHRDRARERGVWRRRSRRGARRGRADQMATTTAGATPGWSRASGWRPWPRPARRRVTAAAPSRRGCAPRTTSTGVRSTCSAPATPTASSPPGGDTGTVSSGPPRCTTRLAEGRDPVRGDAPRGLRVPASRSGRPPAAADPQ